MLIADDCQDLKENVMFELFNDPVLSSMHYMLGALEINVISTLQVHFFPFGH